MAKIKNIIIHIQLNIKIHSMYVKTVMLFAKNSTHITMFVAKNPYFILKKN